MNDRALERALKALTLILQAGNFGVVAFDAADVPPRMLQQLPFTTWRRLHRNVEGSQTVCVLAGDEPIARSAGGVTLKMVRTSARAFGSAARPWADGALLGGLDLAVEIVRPRGGNQEDVRVPLSTACR
jgi:hypothetical protein